MSAAGHLSSWVGDRVQVGPTSNDQGIGFCYGSGFGLVTIAPADPTGTFEMIRYLTDPHNLKLTKTLAHEDTKHPVPNIPPCRHRTWLCVTSHYAHFFPQWHACHRFG